MQTAMAGLTAELERLQKPSGSEALRARLQKLRASEARARSVLSSRELGSAGDSHHSLEYLASKPVMLQLYPFRLHLSASATVQPYSHPQQRFGRAES